MDHHADFIERERLQDVIAGTRLHSFDGGFHGSERGHNDNRHCRLKALNGLEEIEAIHAWQLEIRKYQINRTVLQQLQTGFSILGR